MKRFLALVVMTTAALLTWSAAPASAHAQLVSSDPAAGSTIHALPEAVSLTFSGDLVTVGDGNKVTVVDPMHETISAARSDVSGRVLSTVLSPSMVMDGTYQVSFRAVSSDGHVAEGTFSFRVDSSAPETGGSSAPDVVASGTATLTVDARGSGIPSGAGATSGSASATFDVDLATSTACYTIVTSGVPDVTAAHVHSASTTAMTIDDEIYIPVDLAAVDTGRQVCAQLKRRDLVALVRDPGRYALVVHTRAYPEGAVAGEFTTLTSSGLVLPGVASTEAASAPSSTASTGLPLWLRGILGAAVVGAVVLLVAGRRSGARRATDGGPEDEA